MKAFKIENKNNPIEINIKYWGEYIMTRDRKPQGKSINEIIRIINAKEEEYLHIKEKFGDQVDLIDCEARNTFISRVSFS